LLIIYHSITLEVKGVPPLLTQQHIITNRPKQGVQNHPTRSNLIFFILYKLALEFGELSVAETA
jgi:hypothetical protein